MKTPTRKRAAKATVSKVVTEAMQSKPDEKLAPVVREAQDLLFRARVAQTIFWGAVSDLELHLGFEIDSSQDLDDVSIEDLKASKGAPV